MRIGAFEVQEPLPELRDPHIFAILQPWIDVGSVGTLTLGTLESQFNATELGRLARPSQFYDLTRYRPMLYRRGGERIVEIPNTIVRYAVGDGGNDFVFLHILEPHSNGEDFVDSLLELADRLNVRRYCQLGAMYGSTPHTRPLLASGQASDPNVQTILERAGVRSSNYEGPTSMMAIATQELVKRGVDTRSFEEGDVEMTGRTASMALAVRQGIEADLARELVKMVKTSKLKVQASIQGNQVRVAGKKRDDLQNVIAMVKEAKPELPLQYVNFRD